MDLSFPAEQACIAPAHDKSFCSLTYSSWAWGLCSSRIVRGLATPLLSVMTVASVITLYHLLKDVCP